MKCKHTGKIIRGIEYVSMDCYAYVIRCKKCNKLICTGWSEEECEKEYQSIIK